MNYLIDINHPCHVHLYKNLYFELSGKGKVVITVKQIESARKLLDKYIIPFIPIGVKYDSPLMKSLSQLLFTFRVLKIVKKNNINIGIGVSLNLPLVSKFSKMNSIMMDDDDDDVIPLSVKFAHPSCTTLLSPDVLKGKRKRKDTLYYPGYHELAYLHPNRFKPDQNVLADVGVKTGECFFIMRFNAFKAHHDAKVIGLSLQQKIELVNVLRKKGKIFITTERDLEQELTEYQLRISPEKTHSLLYYSTMFVGDSQTMTSEAAVLGTPALRCNSLVGRISYLEEQEHKYGLTYGFKPENFNQLLDKVEKLLAMPDLKMEWRRRREIMLADKIDVTSFLLWFLKNYPDSINIVRNNTIEWEKFK